jgi:hypothetical protein
MVVFLIIIVYRIYQIIGCKFGTTNRLLKPNLFKGDELYTFPTMQESVGA